MSVLALDIGTSRIKALVASWDGRIAPVRSVPTPVLSDMDGTHAFPADAVHASAETLIAQAAAAHTDDPIDTIVLSCLGTAMVPLDRAGIPLGPALSPADTRPMAVAGLMDRVAMPEEELFDRTGSDPHLASFLMHWLWWREAHPTEVERLHRFRSLRGFVVHALCGADAEDPSWASRTMLMDLGTDTWSPAILAAADLPADVLPPILPPTSAWSLSPPAARRLGLGRRTQVVLGAMDNCCAFLGAADPDEQRLVNIAGTYEHMASVGDLPPTRAAAIAVTGLIHRYLLPGRFLGYSRIPVGLLLGEIAASSPIPLQELLDSVSVERTGRMLAPDVGSVRAALRTGTAPADVLQSVLESCAAVLVTYAQAWVAADGLVDRIVAVGGGAAHTRVNQLKANLLGRPLSTLTLDEAAGLGALRLAAMAIRNESPADACRRFRNPIAHTFSP